MSEGIGLQEFIDKNAITEERILALGFNKLLGTPDTFYGKLVRTRYLPPFFVNIERSKLNVKEWRVLRSESQMFSAADTGKMLVSIVSTIKELKTCILVLTLFERDHLRDERQEEVSEDYIELPYLQEFSVMRDKGLLVVSSSDLKHIKEMIENKQIIVLTNVAFAVSKGGESSCENLIHYFGYGAEFCACGKINREVKL